MFAKNDNKCELSLKHLCSYHKRTTVSGPTEQLLKSATIVGRDSTICYSGFTGSPGPFQLSLNLTVKTELFGYDSLCSLKILKTCSAINFVSGRSFRVTIFSF